MDQSLVLIHVYVRRHLKNLSALFPSFVYFIDYTKTEKLKNLAKNTFLKAIFEQSTVIFDQDMASASS